jgi:hypothetical protein
MSGQAVDEQLMEYVPSWAFSVSRNVLRKRGSTKASAYKEPRTPLSPTYKFWGGHVVFEHDSTHAR